MTTTITIRATRPDGVTMFWSDSGWTGHASDAKDWRTHEAAAQAVNWDQPFKGIRKLGRSVEVVG